MSSRRHAAVAPPSGGGNTSPPDVNLVERMPPVRDPEVATIFREMRRAMGVSRERIAGRLATSVATIDVLESGDLPALPEWDEVSRIVTAYTAQLGLDSRPILRRMKGQIDALKPGGQTEAGTEPGAATPQAAPFPPPASDDIGAFLRGPEAPAADASFLEPAPEMPAIDADFLPEPVPEAAAPTDAEQPSKPSGLKGRIAGLARMAASWGLLIALVGTLGYGLWFASQNPKAVWSAVDSLPDPLPGAMRGAWGLVRPLDEPQVRPQVFDPDKRKSDKLP